MIKQEFQLADRQKPVSTEGTRRVTEVDTETKDSPPTHPDPEVEVRQVRRRFSKSYKLRILDQIDRCAGKGEKSALLRSEGLYSQAVARWRKQRREGGLTSSSKAVQKAASVENSNKRRLIDLELENERLHRKLEQAHKIIDIQKKMSELLQIPDDDENGGEN